VTWNHAQVRIPQPAWGTTEAATERLHGIGDADRQRWKRRNDGGSW
jgi:hypothetical protein